MADTYLMTHLAEGAGVLLAVIVAFFGVRASRSPRRRYARMWAPLAPLIQGTAQGAALAGTYNGFPVHVRLAPESSSDASSAYFYELTLIPGAGGGNWQALVTGQKFLGGGELRWRIRAKDEDLARRLTDAGVVEKVQALPPEAEVSYTAKSGALLYRVRADGADAVPAPEAFQTQLDLLDGLARINRAHNG